MNRTRALATPAAATGLVVAALLGALFLQAVSSMRLLSATFDETTHLPSGYTYLETGDFRLNTQHPPLIKLLAAVPLVFLDPALDLEDPGWRADPPDEWGFGYRFLYGNDADRLLFWGRLPVVLLSLLMAFYVYLWARQLFGRAAGLAALSLCAFSPTVVAHARFVTFDVGLACFSTLALYHLWRHSRGGGWRHLVPAGLGLGLALATKFSGVLLIPVFGLLLGWCAFRPPDGDRPAAGARVRSFLLPLGAVLVLAAFVVEAAYFFPADPTVYFKGLLQVNVDHTAGFPYYLMGEFRPGGWWYYFLAAFLFKTPLPTLILVVVALAAVRRLRAETWLDEAFLALPIVVYTVATSALADNIGVRYLLPVYPLLFVFAARLAAALKTGRAAWLIAGALGLWYVAGTIAIYPDHLAYFNEVAGGPSRGHRLLDDSNIDWGQDLKRLKRYLDRHGIERVKLRIGPHAAPGYYGIRGERVSDAEWSSEHPPPGVYAFSTHVLVRGNYYARERGVATDWLERHEPIDRVGYSCYLFRFD